MTILFDRRGVTLHHADALDVVTAMPTESVHLIATDPPYGQEWQSRRRAVTFDQLLGDGAHERDDIAAVLTQCVRVVGQNRHLYVFGPDDVLAGLKISEPASLVWDKATIGGGDVTSPWGPQHEPITFAISKHRHAGKTGASSVPARLRKGSILSYPRPTGRKVRHPSEKPVALLRELLESSSRQGETVLDPYAGTGSTGVAALLANRRAILVELDEATAHATRARLNAAADIADQADTA